MRAGNTDGPGERRNTQVVQVKGRTQRWSRWEQEHKGGPCERRNAKVVQGIGGQQCWFRWNEKHKAGTRERRNTKVVQLKGGTQRRSRWKEEHKGLKKLVSKPPPKDHLFFYLFSLHEDSRTLNTPWNNLTLNTPWKQLNNNYPIMTHWHQALHEKNPVTRLSDTKESSMDVWRLCQNKQKLLAGLCLLLILGEVRIVQVLQLLLLLSILIRQRPSNST